MAPPKSRRSNSRKRSSSQASRVSRRSTPSRRSLKSKSPRASRRRSKSSRRSSVEGGEDGGGSSRGAPETSLRGWSDPLFPPTKLVHATQKSSAFRGRNTARSVGIIIAVVVLMAVGVTGLFLVSRDQTMRKLWSYVREGASPMFNFFKGKGWKRDSDLDPERRATEYWDNAKTLQENAEIANDPKLKDDQEIDEATAKRIGRKGTGSNFRSASNKDAKRYAFGNKTDNQGILDKLKNSRWMPAPVANLIPEVGTQTDSETETPSPPPAALAAYSSKAESPPPRVYTKSPPATDFPYNAQYEHANMNEEDRLSFFNENQLRNANNPVLRRNKEIWDNGPFYKDESRSTRGYPSSSLVDEEMNERIQNYKRAKNKDAFVRNSMPFTETDDEEINAARLRNRQKFIDSINPRFRGASQFI